MIVDSKEYKYIHGWVRSKLGSPKKECAIDKNHKSGQFSWCNISREYKKETDDWITLCRSCHRLFDFRKLTVAQLRDIFIKRLEIINSL